MLAISDFTERLVDPFPIYPGVLVPVGIYDADTLRKFFIASVSTGTNLVIA